MLIQLTEFQRISDVASMLETPANRGLGASGARDPSARADAGTRPLRPLDLSGDPADGGGWSIVARLRPPIMTYEEMLALEAASP